MGEKDYALGETLPPHLSPFIADRRVGDYVPPEEKKLTEGKEGEPEEETEEKEIEEKDEDSEEDEDDSEEDEGEEEEEDEESNGIVAGMAVEVGKKEEVLDSKTIEDEEEYRLRVMMIKNKHRGLYRSMMKGRKRRENEAKIMEKKRKVHDDAERAQKKAKQVVTL